MNKFNIALLSALLLVVACDQNSKSPETKQPEIIDNEGLSLQTESHFNLNHEKLRLFPILANEEYRSKRAHIGDLLTLEDALSDKKIRIAELEALNGELNTNNAEGELAEEYNTNGAVNTLRVMHSGDPKDTIFLMAGDIIVGGKQDRIIAEDKLIAANGGKWQPVKVFCVEPHRWNYNDAENTSKEDEQLFAMHGSLVSGSVRYAAIYDQNQGRVWDEVGSITEANNATTESGSYNALNKQSDFAQKRNDYLKALGKSFDGNNYVVGVIAVSGKKVLGCDIFATNALFKKQYKNLLMSYVSDAMTYGSVPSISNEDVTSFFNSSMKEFGGPVRHKNEKNRKYAHKGVVLHYTNLDSSQNQPKQQRANTLNRSIFGN